MTSIKRVQTERLLQDVIHTLYADGREPLFAEVATRMSKYFSTYPAGTPLPIPKRDAIAEDVSDVDEYNKLLSFLAINLDVLYESSLRQVEDILELTNSMQVYLDRLKAHRRRVEGDIDDYLLGLYNTDGYFLSISDNFADVTYTDLGKTSAHVDTEVGAVLMPSISNTSSVLSPDQISKPDIRVRSSSGVTRFDELAPFTGAIEDSLNNIVWAMEVRTSVPEEVIAEVEISIGNGQDPVDISQIMLNPYGATPVQVYFHTKEGSRLVGGDKNWVGFGNKIQTGTTKMLFGTEPVKASSIKMTLRKTDPDYTEVMNGKMYYKYIFGAKSITFTHKIYESSARHVSIPLFIPDDLYGDMVIDAVSADIVDDVPSGTNIDYYVAASSGDPDEEFDDLIWEPIIPVGSNEPGQKIVKFKGATTQRRRIVENPSSNDLQLLPISTSGNTGSLNPSPMIIPGVDVYRIAEFEEEVLLNSLELLEGVNTTKIYSKSIDPFAELKDMNLGYWANVFNNIPDKLNIDYGNINSGDEFFYGGDVGAVGKDVFVETFLDADRTYATFLDEFQKLDARSLGWDIKVYLNGRPIGHLPPNTQKLQLPWSFIQGLNHIVLLIRIPQQSAYPDSFLGSLALMGSAVLYDYGLVRLAKWNYVDIFKMRYNETGEPTTFTIHDGEIISRRKPTTNFEIRYAKATDKGPEAVRFRTEMTRSRNSPNLTPVLDSYRIRFSYAEDD